MASSVPRAHVEQQPQVEQALRCLSSQANYSEEIFYSSNRNTIVNTRTNDAVNQDNTGNNSSNNNHSLNNEHVFLQHVIQAENNPRAPIAPKAAPATAAAASHSASQAQRARVAGSDTSLQTSCQLVAIGEHPQQEQRLAHIGSCPANASIDRHHMSQDGRTHLGGQAKSLVQSNSPLASSYDAGYTGGMSSDSELTLIGAGGTRHGSHQYHHHHHHHHRPYSSQSRVYYAHPVPRNSAASTSRLSNYYANSPRANSSTSSTSAAAAMQSSSSSSIPQVAAAGQADLEQTPSSAYHGAGHGLGQVQHQSSAPHHLTSDATAAAMQPMNKTIGAALGHQTSAPSSSSGASSPYLAGGSSISPIMLQQQPGRPKTGGRQLPQRPFKQSVSIDPNNSYSQLALGAQGLSSHYSGQMGAGEHTSPAHHQSQLGMSSARNMLDSPTDHLATGHYGQQQQQQQQQQQSAYQQTRNLRHKMDIMEKQAAEMNLYDEDERRQPQQPSVMGLPPTGMPINRPQSSSASSSRQLPLVGQQQQLYGSMTLDQGHRQSQQLQQFARSSDDSYLPHHPQLHHQPTDPYSAQTVRQQQQQADWLAPMGLAGQYARQTSQFKQTMSIDHYQGRLYSPSRGAHLVGADQYYPAQQPTKAASQHSSYDSPSHHSANHPSSYHSPISSAPHDPVYHQQQMDPMSAGGAGGGGLMHHQDLNSRTGGSSSSVAAAAVNLNSQQAQQHKLTSSQMSRSKHLQRQVSDSSSNSNLSGSPMMNQLDSGSAFSADHRHQQASTSGEHHKASMTHYQHQSPQHKNLQQQQQHHYGSRQDGLRRGYTSIAVTSGAYNDLCGSQSALSEAGDLSVAQTSHSAGPSSDRTHNLRAASPSLATEGSSSHHHHHHHSHHHGQQSASTSHEIPSGVRSESTTGLPNGSGTNSTLTKKSNSATQLSMSGTKKRLGFRKKQVTSFSVHRSEEVAPLEARHLVKQGSSVSEGDSSMSGDSSSRSWSNSNFKPQNSEELASMSFIDGLGKGQMISRQGLTSPYLGDIQLSLCDRRGNLEVEIIRARNLVAKASKIQPLTYVKLYLVKNRKCLAKAKTTLSNKRTLNPLFQQQLTFHEDYHGCILQSIVWGNFGKMDKKNFMGIAQISIDDLELSDTVISWYKLFLPSSLQTLPSKSLRHTLLSNSTESFTNTNNS